MLNHHLIRLPHFHHLISRRLLAAHQQAEEAQPVEGLEAGLGWHLKEGLPAVAEEGGKGA